MDKSVKSSSSWPRVALEGTVIVVSILFAFGIDAWWDGRLDGARAETYIASIREDVVANRNRLEATRSEAEKEMRAAVALGEWLKGDRPTFEPDSVLSLVARTFAIAFFEGATQGYDQVVAAGDLGLLPVPLRSAMNEWDESVWDLQDSANQMVADRHQTYLPFLIENVPLRRAFLVSGEAAGAPLGESAFQDTTEELLGSRELDNLLVYRIVFIDAQLTRLETMSEILDRLDEILE